MGGSMERMRAWNGPAVLSYGFRPMFLGAAIWASGAMALWIGVLGGRVTLPTRFAPVDWHAHELVFGFLPAVIAGFLLTAVPKWTGRMPVVGWPLLALWTTWVAGRAAVLVSGLLPAGVSAAVDLAFLAALAAVIGREVVAGRNYRNLVVLGGVLLLLVANALFHRDAALGAAVQGAGARLGIAVGVFLILLIGGRIVQSFTRNWLAQRGGPLPAPFGAADWLAMLSAAIALPAWVLAPEARTTGVACLAAGFLHLIRLGRWCGERTLTEPLVLIRLARHERHRRGQGLVRRPGGDLQPQAQLADVRPLHRHLRQLHRLFRRLPAARPSCSSPRSTRCSSCSSGRWSARSAARRPGWIADRFGGGRVTFWVFVGMIAAVFGVIFFLGIKEQPGAFWGFFACFLALFFLTGSATPRPSR